MSLVSKSREGGQLHTMGGGQRPGEGVQYELSRSHRGEGLRAALLQHFHLSDQMAQEQVLVPQLQRGIEADIRSGDFEGEKDEQLAVEDDHVPLIDQLAVNGEYGVPLVRGGAQAVDDESLLECVSGECRPMVLCMSIAYMSLGMIRMTYKDHR